MFSLSGNFCRCNVGKGEGGLPILRGVVIIVIAATVVVVYSSPCGGDDSNRHHCCCKGGRVKGYSPTLLRERGKGGGLFSPDFRLGAMTTTVVAAAT